MLTKQVWLLFRFFLGLRLQLGLCSNLQTMTAESQRMPINKNDLRLCHIYPHSTMCTCVQGYLHQCYTLVFLTEDAFCFVGVSICTTHWVKLLGAASRFMLVALGLYTHANWYYSSSNIQRNNTALMDPFLIMPQINFIQRGITSSF